MDKKNNSWSKQTVLEPDTGKHFNRYFYKRKPAHRVVVNTPKAKALAGYALIEKDLRSAILWLNCISEILQDDNNWRESGGHHKADYNRAQFNQVKALFVAALIFYGKCFSKCEGRRVKLEKSNLGLQFHEVHDRAIDLRNNFAAHSGKGNIEKATVVIALDKKRKSLPYFSIELMQPDGLGYDSLNQFIELFEHVKSFVDSKIEVLVSRIKEEDLAAKGIDYWYGKIVK